jgi:hypothetical protein
LLGLETTRTLTVIELPQVTHSYGRQKFTYEKHRQLLQERWLRYSFFPSCEINSEQKLHVLSHKWNIDLIKIQQCYEKQVMLRGGHMLRREGSNRQLRR